MGLLTKNLIINSSEAGRKGEEGQGSKRGRSKNARLPGKVAAGMLKMGLDGFHWMFSFGKPGSCREVVDFYMQCSAFIDKKRQSALAK